MYYVQSFVNEEKSQEWLNTLTKQNAGRLKVDGVSMNNTGVFVIIAHTWLPGPAASPVHTDVAQAYDEPAIEIDGDDADAADHPNVNSCPISCPYQHSSLPCPNHINL
jgi:hypothetical protein